MIQPQRAYDGAPGGQKIKRQAGNGGTAARIADGSSARVIRRDGGEFQEPMDPRQLFRGCLGMCGRNRRRPDF